MTAASKPSPRRYYVLALLWLVSMISFLDRQVLSVLLEPIKAEFVLSDTQLGLLGGVAFGTFYAIFGLPIAGLVDRFNRRNLLASSIFFWSLMTGVCGLAGSFSGLFVARAGVAVGEAGGSPSTASLLSDYFGPRERGRAFAILAMAIPVSIMVGYTLGGLLNDLYGWRMTFVLIGMPGVLVALIVLLTVREPVRGMAEQIVDGGVIPMREAIGRLWARPAYRYVTLGGAMVSMGAWGSGLWLPSYFVRSHGFSMTAAGTAIGLIFGIAGIVGTMSGGFLADRLASRRGDDCWYLRLPMLALLATIPLAFGVYLTDNAALALVLLFANVMIMHVYAGPHGAMLQGLAEPRMRGLSQSIYNFVNSLVAMGMGPLVIGVISDVYRVEEGGDALRYAILAVVCFSYGAAALFFKLATRSLPQGLAAARGA